MDTQQLPAGVRDFIRTVSRQCQAHGVEFSMEDDSRVQYADTSMRVSGYFIDRPSPQLKVATRKSLDQWLGVLVHEFCHMRQWLEESPAWSGVFMQDGREAGDWLDDWIGGEDMSPDRVKQIIAAVQQVEHDCESRVLEAIDEFDLPLDRDLYARRANAYVHFYQHIAKTRQWYDEGRAPYEIDDLVQSMPMQMVALGDAMPEELADAFHRHYPVQAPATPPKP